MEKSSGPAWNAVYGGMTAIVARLFEAAAAMEPPGKSGLRSERPLRCREKPQRFRRDLVSPGGERTLP